VTFSVAGRAAVIPFENSSSSSTSNSGHDDIAPPYLSKLERLLQTFAPYPPLAASLATRIMHGRKQDGKT
jgi:hypothetical protein